MAVRDRCGWCGRRHHEATPGRDRDAVLQKLTPRAAGVVRVYGCAHVHVCATECVGLCVTGAGRPRYGSDRDEIDAASSLARLTNQTCLGVALHRVNTGGRGGFTTVGNHLAPLKQTSLRSCVTCNQLNLITRSTHSEESPGDLLDYLDGN